MSRANGRENFLVYLKLTLKTILHEVFFGYYERHHAVCLRIQTQFDRRGLVQCNVYDS